MLLAGPGTGKTTKVKSIIREDYPDAKNVLVLSFTNATINDLKGSFKDFNNVSCYTLHSYALKINHLPNLHVLQDPDELPIIRKLSEKINISFDDVCVFLRCITFFKMIEQCIAFIKSNPPYATENIGNPDLLIVDEFQDFNAIERELVYLLAQYSKDSIILGDDDQSIYDFKDADPDGIISLYKNSAIDKLDHDNVCYRCPDSIVDYCSKLISRNSHRVGKDWHKSSKRGDVVFVQKMTMSETHKYICDRIKPILENKNTVLVLSPVSYYVDDFRGMLDQNNIPFVDFWSTKISMELRMKIWWVKALFGEHKLLFLLLLAKELKLYSKKSFIKKVSHSFQSSFDESTLIKNIINYFPKPFSDYLLAPINVDEFFERHADFSALREHIASDKLSESIGKLERNINPVVNFDNDSVNIMSIHKSKGLQADYVFILGLNDGVLPNEVWGVDSLEAQRRLLFVGMTRARVQLHMVSTVEWDGKFVNKVDKKQFKYKFYKKKWYGKASRFIEEIKK